ncbi:hypothetical protein EPUS_00906 [Endocarpon pusillum Z07020]|uniref:Uncharacterized protein n=1 Tax=Endocarpon pusillum (strain Z07020 / HMAS-L-300199) TaxID=1263415 RepID=U1GN22_ENDPU|nr:uncharacterized protein EPUS_00906 [Endocarpon pusillum Z07020]ERF73653.1 hypothetical protein EPUS_00906 [Endocarpon pusillum Z07020]
MSFSPERQESSIERNELSPQALLPSDLLESSPEIGTSSQTAIDTVSPLIQSTTTAQRVARTPPAATTWVPRHHDLILERNDQFVDETWALMSGGPLRTAGQHTQASQVVPYTPGEPGPALSSTPGQMPAQASSREQRLTEQPQIFLPPGHGRTPQQRAAVANFNAAVAARARQRAAADRARQAHLATSRDQPNNENIGTPQNDQAQASGPGEHQRGRAELGNIASPAAPTPAAAAPTTTAMQTPLLTDPPMTLEPGQSIEFPMAFDTAHPLYMAINSLGQPANDTDTRPRAHEGNSIFRDMMNSLIAQGRAWPATYRQVHLPRNRHVPYGKEFLYYGEMIDNQHSLFPRAATLGGDPIAIRNARDGEIAGWQDAASNPRSRIYLVPTLNPGRWHDGMDGSENYPRGRGRRRR